MKKKYIFILALSAAFSLTLAAQDKDAPEKRVVDTGASKPLSLEETTSAISVITSEDISRRNSKNVGGSMLGQGRGLISLQGAGIYSNQNPTFYVRGLQTLNGNDAPLVLVDGIERDITAVSAEEVESVVILKDAAAVALYGYKGINGAIQINTKRGARNTRAVKFTYDHQFNSLLNKPQFVDGYTYGLAINEARANDGLSARYSDQEIAALKSGQYPYLYPSVDWVNETFRNTASTDNFNMEFSGGEGRFRYYAMIDLISDKGFIRNADANEGYSTQDKYVRGNMRLNMDLEVTPTTDMRVNLLGMMLENSRPGANKDIWDMVYTVPSAAFPVKDDKGVWAGSDTWDGEMNPVAQTTGAAYYKNHNRLLFADVTLNQDLSALLPGLAAFVRAGYDQTANIYENHSKTYIYHVNTPSWPAGASEPAVTSKTQGKDSAMGSGANTNAYSRRAHVDAGVTYDAVFGDHTVNSQFKWDYEYSNINGVNKTVFRHNLSWWTHYGYAGKYFADLALVESGSSRLAPGTKWSFSPTLSLAWIASKEDFLSGADWLDLLKLRASAGILNADFLPGEEVWTYYAQQYNTSGGTYPFSSSFTSDFGRTYLGRLATTSPSHEKAYKYNVGIDSRMFGGLSFSLDAYWQRRSDIWVSAEGKYSAVVGKDAPYENGGIVDSWGTEVGIDYVGRAGGFEYTLGGNFNFNRNKIVSQLEEPRMYENLIRTGGSVGQIYGMKAIGFFKDEADIASSPVQNFSTVRPGDIKYEDVNGDNVIDANDLAAIGYSNRAPQIYYNFHLGAEWKGLGFYALFQGAARYSAMLNTKSMYFPLVDNTTISQYYFDNRWTPSSQDAKFPRLSSESNANNYRSNTIFLADRSFLKLRNFELYYKLPEPLLARTKFIRGTKFYVRGNDLFCLDHLDVSDPEAYGTGQLFRSVVLGLSLTF